MRKEQRKQLDHMLRRQGLRRFLIAAAVLLPILVLLAWWLDPRTAGASRIGTVVGLRQAQREVPGPPRFIVELESDRTVYADGTGHLLYEPGRKVVLQEYEGMIFGRRTYRFLRYAGE